MRHNNPDEFVHKPVLYKKVIEIAENAIGTGEKIFVDCTLGEGGHSELLLQSYPELKIIGFDRDPEIIEIAEKRLNNYKERIEFINDNWTEYCGSQ